LVISIRFIFRARIFANKKCLEEERLYDVNAKISYKSIRLHGSNRRRLTLTLRLLMSYIYIYINIYIYIYVYGAPIFDVSRSHTTTQHSR